MTVYEFAVKIEDAGFRFYNDMAIHAPQAAVAELCRQKAETERRMRERYTLLSRIRVGAHDSTELTALAAELDRCFAESRLMPPCDDEVAAYRILLNAQEAICRYCEQAMLIETDPEIRNQLDVLAADERRVLDELRNLFDFVHAPAEYLAWGEFSNLGEYHNFGRSVD